MENIIYEKIQAVLQDVKRNGLIRQDVAGKDYVSLLNSVQELLEIEYKGTFHGGALAKV